MAMDFNRMLTSELGPFIYGKTSWLEYQNKMDKFFDEHDVCDNDRKRDVCVSMIGVRCLKILKILISPQNIQDVNYETVLAQLESHFYPKLTRVHYIFKFSNRRQKRRERFFNYVVALRKLIIHCSYDDPEDQLKQQIMVGVRDEDLKNEFREANCTTLTKIFEIGLAYDDKRAIKAVPHPRNHKARINRDKTCFRCKESILRTHRGEVCPFEWSECEHCHVTGHLSIACKYKELQCNYCSRKGHITRICSRKLEDNEGSRLLSVLVTSRAKEGSTAAEKIISISNLRINTTEDELRNHFGKYGEIRSITMEEDSTTNRFNGTAQISYKQSKSYKRVMSAKVIHIL